MKMSLTKASNAVTAKKQRGVAIITALLIVTLAATISITISTRLQLDVRRTSNLVASDQAYIYTLLSEEAFQVILADDDARESFIELLIREGKASQPLLIDDASIIAEVTDLNACININSLVDNNGTINPVVQTRLAQLFSNRGINNNLIPAIADWIDEDLNTRTNGAEDSYYLNLEKPYRTAQTPILSISELRLIKGFEDPKVYESILKMTEGTYDKDSGRFSGPEICAFTARHNSDININTASVEVLKSIQSGIKSSDLKDILDDRENAPLTKMPAVFKTPDGLTLDSSYYLLKTRVVIGNANKVTYSIIYWDGKNISTVSRTQRTL